MSTNQFSTVDGLDHERYQWIKILSWGDNSLTEFFVSVTRRMKKATCLTRQGKLTDKGFPVHLKFLMKTCINLMKQKN